MPNYIQIDITPQSLVTRRANGACVCTSSVHTPITPSTPVHSETTTPVTFSTTLGELDDVTITDVVPGNILTYTGYGQWVNAGVPEHTHSEYGTVASLSTVATTGSYNDLIDTPEPIVWHDIY